MAEDAPEVVHRLSRDEWWLSVRDALDELSEADAVSYQSDSRKLGTSLVEGLEER